jgi:hypothetical protein
MPSTIRVSQLLNELSDIQEIWYERYATYNSDQQPVCHFKVSGVPRIFITNCI